MSAEPRLSRYHARWHRWARFVAQRLVLGPVVRTVTDVSVVGAEHLRGVDGPFVIVTNHSSHLDAPLVVTRLPYRLTRQLAVNAAADYFYQRWWMKALTSLFFNTFPVQRTVESMGKGRAMSARLLGEGIPVLIFPQGTRRSGEGSAVRFKPGAASLCLTYDVPCVPIAILGTDAAMPVGRFWPVWGRPPVMLLVGAPMRPDDGEKLRGFNARVEAKVSAMMAVRSAEAEATTTEDDHRQEEAS